MRVAALSCMIGVLLWGAQAKLPGVSQVDKVLAPKVDGKEPKRPLLPLRPRHEAVEASGFHAGGPVSPDGTEVVVDLPLALRKRNIASKGLGCCVFRSLDHTAHWQSVPQLYGMPEWMVQSGIEGGGYPQKVDALIARISLARKMAKPPYVQHTGGDEAFLELVLKTGRLPTVTYAGHDGVYYQGPIDHMVNLAGLGEKWAAILDNNYPDKFLWMPRKEFLTRWRERGGGWCVALLAAPASPVPH